MPAIEFLHPKATWDHVGMIPQWINDADPTPVTQQLDRWYAHGGGWHKFEGFAMIEGNCLKYPGDPALKPIAKITLGKHPVGNHEEVVFMYEHSWVAVVMPDGSFEVCRMD